jgi:hypothetical protein
MSILDTIRSQTNSLDDLAALPQAMIMQMAQKGQIREDMLAPILGRKAEMADAVARTKALQSQGQPMPTVMEQLMQRNAETEMPEAREMGVAQLPIRDDMYSQGMAGGGIVAFYDGGEVDEDDEDSEYYQEAFEDAQMEDMLNKSSMSGIGRLMPRTGGIGITAPKREEESTPSVGIKPTGGDYKTYAAKMAEKYDVDPDVILKMMAKETGGLKNPEVAVSPKGAVGVMQLMPATAKELGVKDPTNPFENIEGGVKYFARLEKKYDNPQLAMIAYNWGPGNTDKWLKSGADVGKLPKETRKYIDMMAEGGAVRYQTGGTTYSDPLDYFSGMDPESMALDEIRRQKDLDKYKALYGTDKYAKPKKAAEKEVEPDISGYMQGDDTYIPELNVDSRATPIGKREETPPAKPEDPFTKALARFEARQKKLDESAGDDKYMALLAAGLGMLGGTSQNALTNIGAGGAKGLEQYAASKRARTAEELANEKLLGSTLKAKEYSDIRQMNAKALEDSRLRDDYLAARKQIEANVMARYKGDPALFDAKTKAKIAQEIQDALNSDEYFGSLASKMGLKVGTGKPTTIGSYNLKSGLNLNK